MLQLRLFMSARTVETTCVRTLAPACPVDEVSTKAVQRMQALSDDQAASSPETSLCTDSQDIAPVMSRASGR